MGSCLTWAIQTFKAEVFHKVEPYLTFLNIPQLERQSADIQSKVEEVFANRMSLPPFTISAAAYLSWLDFSC